ncbi:MAG: hypothetical protein E7330_07940 [Clostridiales bacterium]|nr:hypothetical protein [Clostridiales bacterium]
MRLHKGCIGVLAVILILLPAVSRADPLPAEAEDMFSAYDLSGWSAFYEEALPESMRELWGEAGISDLLSAIAGGNGIAYESVPGAIQAILVQAFKRNLRIYTSFIAAVLFGCAAEILTGGKGTLGETVRFFTFGMSAAAVSSALMEQVNLARSTIELLSSFTQIAAPVMSFALAAVGSVSLSGALQPMMLFLNTAITGFFKTVVLPLAAAGGAAAIIGSITEGMGANELHRLIKSAVKWLTGAAFTVYFGIVAIQGLSMGGADSLAIRAAKYTFDKSVPIVGNAMSGTLETVLGSAVMIKNAIGAASMITVLGAAFLPLVQLVTAGFAAKTAGTLCAPLSGDGRISRLLFALSEVYNNLFAAVTAVALMFVICAGLVMAVGNP